MYAHMGIPVDHALGDFFKDVGKVIDTAKAVKDAVSKPASPLVPYSDLPLPGAARPTEPTVLGLPLNTALWAGVGVLAVVVLTRRR